MWSRKPDPEEEEMRQGQGDGVAVATSLTTWRPQAFVSEQPSLPHNAAPHGRPPSPSATSPSPQTAAAVRYDAFTLRDSFSRMCSCLFEPITQAHRPGQKLAVFHAYYRTLPSGAPQAKEEVDGGVRFSFYPYLRLLLPHLDQDGRPNYQLKETKIAQLYKDILALPSNSLSAQQLTHWRDPRFVTSAPAPPPPGLRLGMPGPLALATPNAGPSFSDVVYTVLMDRGGTATRDTHAAANTTNTAVEHHPVVLLSRTDTSALSVVEVNLLLDTLACIGATSLYCRPQETVYPPLPSPSMAATTAGVGSPTVMASSPGHSQQWVITHDSLVLSNPEFTRLSLQEQRLALFRLCVLRMTPVEHKWFIRILLKDLKLGLNHLSIFKALHPYAWSVYGQSSRLEKVCDDLLQPSLGRQAASATASSVNEKKQYGNAPSGPEGAAKLGMEAVGEGIVVFQPCKPMLAAPLHVQNLQKLLEEEGHVLIEPKYDGERILLHGRRITDTHDDAGLDGFLGQEDMREAGSSPEYELQYYTRNGKNFTTVYAPTYDAVIQSHLQQIWSEREKGSTASLPSSFILDGEMLLFDMQAMDFVPFGFTRTYSTSTEAAALATAMLEHLHNQQNKMQKPEAGAAFPIASFIESHIHRWFCFMVFDIVFLNESPLLHLPLTERRAILQKKFYLQIFDPPERRRSPGVQNSTTPKTQSKNLFRSFQHHLEMVPSTRVTSMTHILEALQHALLVEKREGIVIKSALSRYLVGERKAWAWMKLKHDHVAKLADTVDLVVVGAYYGTKFGKRQLTHFLLGAWSEKPSERFIKNEKTVGATPSHHTVERSLSPAPHNRAEEQVCVHTICNVGSGYTEDELSQILKVLEPHWENPYGRPPSARYHTESMTGAGLSDGVPTLPGEGETASHTQTPPPMNPFMDSLKATASPRRAPLRSAGRGPNPWSGSHSHSPPWLDYWRPATRELLPDLYIHPRHSVVFEVMAYAFVEESKNYHVGFTLRFPRLLRVRWDKSVEDAATVEEVRAIRAATAVNLRERLRECLASPASLETVLGAKRKERHGQQKQPSSAVGFALGAGGILGAEEGEEEVSLVSKSIFKRAAAILRQQRGGTDKVEWFRKKEVQRLGEFKSTTTVEEQLKEEGKRVSDGDVGSSSALPTDSQLFQGYEFCVLSFRPLSSRGASWPTSTLPSPSSKPQLESLLRHHGGKVVANPLPRTTSLLLADHEKDLRVVNWIQYSVSTRNHIEKGRKRPASFKAFASTDVAHWSYVMECLAQQRVLPLTPRHMLYISPLLQEKFSVLYDPYEDPYYEPCESLETLRHSLALAREAVVKKQQQKRLRSSVPSSPTSTRMQWYALWQRVHRLKQSIFEDQEEDSVQEGKSNTDAVPKPCTETVFHSTSRESPRRYVALSWSAFEPLLQCPSTASTAEALVHPSCSPRKAAQISTADWGSYFTWRGPWEERCRREEILKALHRWEEEEKQLQLRFGAGEEHTKRDPEGALLTRERKRKHFKTEDTDVEEEEEKEGHQRLEDGKPPCDLKDEESESASDYLLGMPLLSAPAPPSLWQAMLGEEEEVLVSLPEHPADIPLSSSAPRKSSFEKEKPSSQTSLCLPLQQEDEPQRNEETHSGAQVSAASAWIPLPRRSVWNTWCPSSSGAKKSFIKQEADITTPRHLSQREDGICPPERWTSEQFRRLLHASLYEPRSKMAVRFPSAQEAARCNDHHRCGTPPPSTRQHLKDHHSDSDDDEWGEGESEAGNEDLSSPGKVYTAPTHFVDPLGQVYPAMVFPSGPHSE